VTAPNHTDPNFLELLVEAVVLKEQDDEESVEEASMLDKACNNQQ
jgi:hypothetical protein